jgi:predicted regulator of Ras-like GTPase activity (Roadblock/LC7/MglB family)
MMMENTFGDTRSVTATFDDAAKAERAIAWLRNIGVLQGQIRQTRDATPDHAPPVDATSSTQGKRRKGFMDSLVNLVLPDDTPGASAKGKISGGPCSVTVTDIPAAMFDKVVSILSDEGKVKLDTQKPVIVEASKINVADASNTNIADASKIKGLIGACLVDSDSGMMLASEGGDRLDLDLVAALNSDSVRTGQHVVDQLGLDEKIEEILINLSKQVHLIRPLEQNRSMFVYVALDKASSNLGMARIQLKNIEANMKL